MTPVVDITAERHETILSLLERHLPGTTVWAYGSRVKQKSRSTSDLDLVVFASPDQVHRVGDLREAFEESDLPFQVDLFVWDEVPESFRKRIETEHVVLVEKQQRDTGADWPTVPLGHVTELTLSSVDKKIKPGERTVLLCNYMDVYSNRFIRSDLDFMTATATEREIQRCTLQSGDVIITKDSEQYDDIGVPALVRDDINNLICGYHLAILRPLQESVYGPYLFYALQFRNVQHQFHAYANGVTRFGLRKDDILRVEIPLPPVPEQRIIARVLSALDDRIELNRCMNETLEMMARTIFNDWFVDFGPTRTKVASREPYLPESIWTLFPDHLVDSELGEIPEGWSIYCLDGLAEHHTLSVTPSNHPETVFEHFSIPAYDRKRMPAIDRGEDINSNKTVVPSGAVLLSKLNPEIPRVWIPDGSDGGPQICSTEFLAFVAREPASRPLLFCLFTNVTFGEILRSMVTGTSKSHQRVPAAALKRRKVMAGTPALFGRFGELVGPMLERVAGNRIETQILATLRDTLFPKLVSGELRLSEAVERSESVT